MVNNPINASDPTGHVCVGEPGECLDDDDTQSGGFSGTGGAGSDSAGNCSGAGCQGNGGRDDEEIRYIPPGPTCNPDQLYNQQSIYLNTNDQDYPELDGKHWIELLLIPIAVRKWLMANTRWPTVLGGMHNQPPDAYSTVSYYYASTGITKTSEHGIVLDGFSITNKLATESLTANITASFYTRGNALAFQEVGQVRIAPSSYQNVLNGPTFVTSDISQIVLTVYLSSNSYNGEMQHVIKP